MNYQISTGPMTDSQLGQYQRLFVFCAKSAIP